MKVIFSQGFVNEVRVFYGKSGTDDTNAVVRGFVAKGTDTAIQIIERLNRIIKESDIKEVTLVGQTGMLKDLEEYYKNLKEVTITWQ
jgi:purine-nucleoside phosphorylase